VVGVGIALIAVSVPGLYANPAFTAYSYYEDNQDVNFLLGLLSAGALMAGLGGVLLSKGIRVKKEARRRL
jgi:hypothetical protein